MDCCCMGVRMGCGMGQRVLRRQWRSDEEDDGAPHWEKIMRTYQQTADQSLM